MLKNKKLILTKLILSALFILTQNTQAANLTSSIKTSATLSATCQITTNNLNFGVFSPATSGSLYVNTNLILNCSKNLSYKIILSSASSSSNMDSNGYGIASDLNETFIRTSNPNFATSYPLGAARIMNGTKSSDQLVFNLFSDSNHTTPFLDTFYLNEVGTGSAQTIPIYGALPLDQFITPDNYTQSVMVFISY